MHGLGPLLHILHDEVNHCDRCRHGRSHDCAKGLLVNLSMVAMLRGLEANWRRDITCDGERPVCSPKEVSVSRLHAGHMNIALHSNSSFAGENFHELYTACLLNCMFYSASIQ